MIKIAEKHFPEILITSLIFYLFKTAFWPLTYFCLASYAVLFIVFFTRFTWNFNIKEFLKEYFSPLILSLIIILWSIDNEYFRNKIIQKDLTRLVILFSYFYFLFWNRTYLKNKLPVLYGIKLIVYTTVIISVLNLIKNLASGFIPSEILLSLNISEEMALASDYNFFSLFLLLGLVIFNYKNNSSFRLGLPRLTIYFFNILIGINILISGSRRGIIAFLILIVIYFINFWITQKKSFGRVHRRSIVFFALMFIFFLIGLLFFKISSQDKISNIVLHYGSFIGIDDKVKIDRFLWKRELQKSINGNYILTKDFFKRNPGYWIPMGADGTSLSSVITPFGKGIKILREGSLNTGGVSFYYNGPTILYYANHRYKISFKIKFLKGDINSFSVGWFVANGDGGKDFSHILSLVKNINKIDDGWYNSTSYYTFIDNQIEPSGFINSVLNNTEFIIADFELIDLDYSSRLPKFLIELDKDAKPLEWMNAINQPLTSDSNLLINSNFSSGLNYWGHDADSLKISIVNIDNTNAALIERGSGNGENWSLFYNGRHILFKKGDLYRIGFKFKPIIPGRIPFVVGFGIDEFRDSVYAKDLRPLINSLEGGWFQVYAIYRFNENYSDINFPIRYQLNNSKFYIADLSLVNLDEVSSSVLSKTNAATKPEIDGNLSNNYFFSDRVDRYLFSFELWRKYYKWYNKIAGHGFDYLKWFGEKYLKIQDSNDWPHNPFIAVLLYSGIVGLLLYFWLLYNIVSIYVRLRKTIAIAFLCFIMTFYFSFFSGSDPFDPPIMGFFVLLPFFLNAVYKNDVQSSHEILTDDKDSNHGN